MTNTAHHTDGTGSPVADSVVLPTRIARGAVDMAPITAVPNVTGIMLPNGAVIPVAPSVVTSPMTRTVYRGAGTYDTNPEHHMTCTDCGRDRPVTKFPTRPVNRSGIITRVPRCRDCRDGKTMPADRVAIVAPVADVAPVVPVVATEPNPAPVDRTWSPTRDTAAHINAESVVTDATMGVAIKRANGPRANNGARRTATRAVADAMSTVA